MNVLSYYKKLITSQKWVKLRSEKVAKNPLCENCLLSDVTRPTQEVHHIRPVESGSTNIEMERLCFDFDNLKSLCRDCHKKAHIELNSFSKIETIKRNKDKTNSFIDKFLKKT